MADKAEKYFFQITNDLISYLFFHLDTFPKKKKTLRNFYRNEVIFACIASPSENETFSLVEFSLKCQMIIQLSKINFFSW